ncbi:MAG: cryptochrome/photolyase family protein [Candidatus Nanohaloarchaea archaeon]
MAYLLFPDQLFEKVVGSDEKVYLVEHQKFFSEFNYNKKKLVLHRASMKAFQDRLDNVEYLEMGKDWREDIDEKVKIFNPVDRELREDLRDATVEFEMIETPKFLNTMEQNRELIESYYHRDFYRSQRKRLDVLVDEEGKPEGGKWSFDPENREKMPEDHQTPEIPEFSSEYVEGAREYVEDNFPENPGSVDNFFYPVTHEQARENLEDFLENRLEEFGKYQDALDRELKFGYHSLLSPSLNTGLLTPGEVVEETLSWHESRDYPMNSLEGFIRQVIGWREYVRAVYEMEPGMRQKNFWDNQRSIPEEFYSAETGVDPLDVSIRNAKENAYCHHIERLMVLGNVMLILEIDPDEVYRWFMEMFVDAYEWVMVPNIYGMSQYSWSEMMTKPYIASSNYIRKMSNYEGGEWEEYMDGLYWSFLERNREKIEDIPRMGFMTSHLDRMDDETLEKHRRSAEEFEQSLTNYQS